MTQRAQSTESAEFASISSDGGKSWTNVVKNIAGLPKNAWLRGYAYAFIEMFAPQLKRPVVDAALAGVLAKRATGTPLLITLADQDLSTVSFWKMKLPRL